LTPTVGAVSKVRGEHWLNLQLVTTIGLAERIGSVEPGKDADLIAVHMARLDCGPLYDLHSALVYTTSGPSVTHAWVEGRLLLDERRLTEQQPPVLHELMREWRARILSA